MGATHKKEALPTWPKARLFTLSLRLIRMTKIRVTPFSLATLLALQTLGCRVSPTDPKLSESGPGKACTGDPEAMIGDGDDNNNQVVSSAHNQEQIVTLNKYVLVFLRTVYGLLILKVANSL